MIKHREKLQISPARLAAFKILLRIEVDRAFSSILLAQAADELGSKDRSLCYELTLGILRRQLWLDDLISRCSNNKKLDIEVRIALRMGLFQIKFLDRIPDYSAINESVNLVEYAGKKSAKGFVNAILRRAVRGIPPAETVDSASEISLATSHPKWLIEKWIQDFGMDEAGAIAQANNQIPLIAFRATGSSTAAFTAASEKAALSSFARGCFVVESMNTKLLALAAENEIYFQDEASQIAANAVDVNGAVRILDVCAAPGSKTTLIAKNALENNNKVFIVAGDLHSARIGVLRENCRKQGIETVNIVQYNAEEAMPFADRSFDRVLIDAPCSGTGTIRHNPEIRYNISPEDISELPIKQLAILQNASKLVDDGGSLIYSTCSLEPEENEFVCQAFLDYSEDFRVIPPRVHEQFLTSGGFGRTFLHRDGMDGFFIAAFERKR